MILLRIFPAAFLAFLAGAIGPLSSPARAGCFDSVGCTDRNYFSEDTLARVPCYRLDLLRNSIYAENGYCFRKRFYRDYFGTEHCRFDSSGDVPLNRVERANISAIVAVERWKGCRR